MRKKLLKQLKNKLNFYKNLKEQFEKKLGEEKPDFKNARYIKLLTKLSQIEQEIRQIELSIRFVKRKYRFDKQLIISLKSRVKLVSIDFEFTLWVDAKNTSQLLGKKVGDIITLYNGCFRVAGVYS